MTLTPQETEAIRKLATSGNGDNVLLAMETCEGKGLDLYEIVTGSKWPFKKTMLYGGDLYSGLCELKDDIPRLKMDMRFGRLSILYIYSRHRRDNRPKRAKAFFPNMLFLKHVSDHRVFVYKTQPLLPIQFVSAKRRVLR